jgi:hypothetical protein
LIGILFDLSVLVKRLNYLQYGKNRDLKYLVRSVLGRIIKPEKEEVTGGWRKLLNEKHRNMDRYILLR